MRILVAEDDTRIAASLGEALQAAGLLVDIEHDGEIAWYRGDTEPYDAIILDLGLPTVDGMTILKRWRKSKRDIPVLILTARGQWDERVEGMEAGADDYVVKPFHIEEVVARLRAILRRAGGLASSRIELGDLVLDTRLMQVMRDGVAVFVPPQEYRLLSLLAHRRGQIVPRMDIIEHLYSQDFDRESNSVEVLVGRLRKRLGSDIIKTRRGFGYYVEGPDP